MRGRRVGDDRRRLLSAPGVAAVGWLYAAHAARYAAPLVLYPVLTRRLGVDGFGAYAAGLSLALAVSVVADYGLSVSGPRDIAANVSARPAFVGLAATSRALLALPAIAVGLGLSFMTPVLQGQTTVTAMAILLGLGQGAGLLWYFQGIGRPAPLAMLEVGLVLAAAVAIVASPGLEVAGVLGWQAAGVWAGVFAGLILLGRNQRVQWPSQTSLVGALKQGAPLLVSRAVIVALAGPAQAALYGAADRLVAAAGSSMRPLAGVIAPRIAGLLVHDPAAAFRTARWTLASAFVAAVAVAAVMAIGAPTMVRALFGPAFADAEGVLRLLAAILPLVAVSQVLGLHLMTSLRMDGRFALMTGAGCAATLCAAWMLAPRFGAVGMAWARIVGEAAVALICLVSLKGRWVSLFPPRSRHVAAI